MFIWGEINFHLIGPTLLLTLGSQFHIDSTGDLWGQIEEIEGRWLGRGG